MLLIYQTRDVTVCMVPRGVRGGSKVFHIPTILYIWLGVADARLVMESKIGRASTP